MTLMHQKIHARCPSCASDLFLASKFGLRVRDSGEVEIERSLVSTEDSVICTNPQCAVIYSVKDFESYMTERWNNTEKGEK